MSELRPFHLAIPVHDLAEAKSFYGDLLGFDEGRSSDRWIDWNFFGHQFVTHLSEGYKARHYFNDVDEHAVPSPHYGVVLNMTDWSRLASRLKEGGIKFVVEPYIRFKGERGEQATMFFLDPSGNALEFKAFADLSSLFEK